MLAVSWREQIGNFRNCNHSKKLVAKIIDANDEIRNIEIYIEIYQYVWTMINTVQQKATASMVPNEMKPIWMRLWN